MNQESRVGTMNLGVAALGRAPVTAPWQEMAALCREPLRGYGSWRDRLAFRLNAIGGRRAKEEKQEANQAVPGYLKVVTRLNGQQTRLTRPRMLPVGTGPHMNNSVLLSVNTRNWPTGTW